MSDSLDDTLCKITPVSCILRQERENSKGLIKKLLWHRGDMKFFLSHVDMVALRKHMIALRAHAIVIL